MMKGTKKNNKKKYKDFRIRKMPKSLYDKIIVHKKTRMIGCENQDEAAMNLIKTAVEFLEKQEGSN